MSSLFWTGNEDLRGETNQFDTLFFGKTLGWGGLTYYKDNIPHRTGVHSTSLFSAHSTSSQLNQTRSMQKLSTSCSGNIRTTKNPLAPRGALAPINFLTISGNSKDFSFFFLKKKNLKNWAPNLILFVTYNPILEPYNNSFWEKSNGVNSGHLVPWQHMQAAQALLWHWTVILKHIRVLLWTFRPLEAFKNHFDKNFRSCQRDFSLTICARFTVRSSSHQRGHFFEQVLRSCLQTFPVTPQKSYPKFWN